MNNNNTTATMQQSFPMNGGDGPHSYLNNSHLQRQANNASRAMIEEAIAKKLDVRCFPSNSLCLADLGCSVGPNTFVAMQHIIDAIENKYLAQGLKSQVLEFQVFFNDHAANDFNTLFASLPDERRYLAAGVPGSFHGRLFPESSIHFMFSSHALHWLSKVPAELLDKNSPAWNRGKIHYTSAPDEVSHAYAAQFEKDMEIFLSARAKELVVGGMIVLLISALPTGIPASRTPIGILFDLLGSSLMDMVKEGLLSEDQVDSFNMPVYITSLEQMKSLVERNGNLSMERIELMDPTSKHVGPVPAKDYVMNFRAGMEGIFSQHFGRRIVDEVFDRLYKKTVEFFHLLKSSHKEGTQLFVVLRRKNDAD